jgi:hypothetical protein
MHHSVSRLVAALFWTQPAAGRAPTPSSSRALARARVALALVIPAFILLLCGAWAAAETVVPEITDTDYHTRLRIARTAQTEHPDRSLGLLIGSSRTTLSFQPEQLTDPDGVYWVNCAHVGAGPILNRVILHRFLRDGVHSSAIVLELMPTYFVKENSRFVCGHFAATDLSFVRTYSEHPLSYDYHFLRHRLTRAPDLARVSDPFAGRSEYDARGGYRGLRTEISPAERAEKIALTHQLSWCYAQNMTVARGADRAFRDTLREAADNGIRVVLLLAPEGPLFRSWYSPDGLARFDQYVKSVATEFGVPLVDARLWLEEEDFYDSHHVLARGADKFTARFAREIPAKLAGR